ncbi:porin family protein [Fodinibius sp. AD559]|uniref:porin family protein n=1 Tax=Fodinibius sp. AD559 TaxID=3424179 RepID=UPI004046ECC2
MGFHLSGQSQSLEYGLTAGLNISNHTDRFRNYESNQLTPSSALGYQVSFMTRTTLNQLLKASLEPSIIMLGANYNESITLNGREFQTDIRSKLYYLHLPVLVQFYNEPKKTGRTVYGNQIMQYSYHFTVGIFGEYLLNARLTGDNIDGNLTRSVFENVIDAYSKYDAGGVVGFGMEFIDKYGFETRLQRTFLQTYNGNPQLKPKNYAFKLSFVYLL